MPPLSSVTAWVTGLGAVSSVGLDAATTCASIRAGISWPSEIEGHESLSLVDYALEPTIGHVVPELSRGFVGVGRWLQLATPAIEDLCSSASLPCPAKDRQFWGATIAYLLTPEPSLRFIVDPLFGEGQLLGTFRDPLLQRTASVFAPARVGVLPHGARGLLELLRTIRWPIEGVERIIVVSTDSLVDGPALEWLTASRRLKNGMNPVGLSPGEASVALMVEDPNAAQRRGARAYAVLHAVATDLDAARNGGEGIEGAGLGRAVSAVLQQTSLHEHGAATQVADINGEVWRAKERAAAQHRVGFERWNDDHMMIPAVSTGDPGAAMPGLQLAIASVALQRGYAGGSSVLVTSSDTLGRVGAAIIGRA